MLRLFSSVSSNYQPIFFQTNLLMAYYSINHNFSMFQKYCSSNRSSNNMDKNSKNTCTTNGDCEEHTEVEVPDAPTNCCMSGCANCVWITYAEELSRIFNDSGKKSREIILSKVTDENMKAFLNMELNFMAQRIKDNSGNNKL